MSQATSQTSIAQIDKALREYYKALGKEEQYIQDDGRGLMEYFCDENGVDEEGLKDEMNVDPADCMLLDFDNDFPTKEQIDNDEQRQEYVFKILKQCYDNPDKSWDDLTVSDGLPAFNDKLFEGIDDEYISKIMTIYEKQCPAIFNAGMASDRSFLVAIAVGHKLNIDYLQILVDDYQRHRIDKNLENKEYTVKNWADQASHFKRTKKFKVSHISKQGDGKVKYKELAHAAVKSRFFSSQDNHVVFFFFVIILK